MLTTTEVFEKARRVLLNNPSQQIKENGFAWYLIDPDFQPDYQFLPVKLHTVTVNGALFDSGIPRDMQTWSLLVDINEMVSNVPVHSWPRWLTIIQEQYGLRDAA